MSKKSFNQTKSGELKNNNIHLFSKVLHTPETPFESNIVPYIILIVCACVDATFFIDLFTYTSFDSQLFIYMQSLALLCGFDVVPCVCGSVKKRVDLGTDPQLQTVVKMSMAVFAICFFANAFLRVAALPLMNPNGAVTVTTISLCILGIVLPLITSLTSYCISYIIYHPGEAKIIKLERMIETLEDSIRKYDSILLELSENHVDRINENDLGQLKLAISTVISYATDYCDRYRINLSKTLDDKTAKTALSESSLEEINKSLTEQLEKLQTEVGFLINKLKAGTQYE